MHGKILLRAVNKGGLHILQLSLEIHAAKVSKDALATTLN